MKAARTPGPQVCERRARVMARERKRRSLLACAGVIALGLTLPGGASRAAGIVRPAEMGQKARWANENLRDAGRRPPFSFVYGGQAADGLLRVWPRRDEARRLDADRAQLTATWFDARSGLEVRFVAVEYADFPAVEWTVFFRNLGRQATPILENIQGLDAWFERGPGGEFVLRYWNGDTFAPDLYQPFALALGPGASKRLAPAGGRGSNIAFPYYNLTTPGGGVLIAVGWPGQWATTFARDIGRGLQVTAGQELTRLTLGPGEQVRTPLIALVFWQGADTVRAQNLWRRWMWAHNVPRTGDGKLPPPLLFGNSALQTDMMCGATEENQNRFLDSYFEAGVPIDAWWMDAGWYPCGGQWTITGTWEPDRTRFPRGLRPVSDHARARGVKTLVWFEPERAMPGTWLAQNHPDWLLGGTLLNLGRPDARRWLTGHIDRLLREEGISIYRQDFNIEPLSYWRQNDPPDRQGVTENLHVQGYLAFWDSLRERHPELIIDSCASGGRRNDLESMRRAIPLLPTDYDNADLTVKQAYHSSLFEWLPCFGSNTVPVEKVDAYAFRSGHAIEENVTYDLRRQDLDYNLLRKLAAEWRAIAPYYYGDYYPLTPYSRDEAVWMAWQFHRPGPGDGMVEAFRRGRNGDPAQVFRLRGLDPSASYEVTDLDSGASGRLTGRELMERGLRVEIPARPGATVVRYRR